MHVFKTQNRTQKGRRETHYNSVQCPEQLLSCDFPQPFRAALQKELHPERNSIPEFFRSGANQYWLISAFYSITFGWHSL